MDEAALKVIADMLIDIHMNASQNNIRALSIKYVLNNTDTMHGMEAGCHDMLMAMHDHDKQFKYARVLLDHQGSKH